MYSEESTNTEYSTGTTDTHTIEGTDKAKIARENHCVKREIFEDTHSEILVWKDKIHPNNSPSRNHKVGLLPVSLVVNLIRL